MINKINVLDNQGFISLIDHMGTEIDIVNAARVSFGKQKSGEMDSKDINLLNYLIEHKHTSPFEHVVFKFDVYCPLFIRSQWHRHRTWSYNEISRRYTDENIVFFVPKFLRMQSENNKQCSSGLIENQTSMVNMIDDANKKCFEVYNQLIENGVCREQARGVLPQNMMTNFIATVDLHNLMSFLTLRDSPHAQEEIREYAIAIKLLIKPHIPNVMDYLIQETEN